MSDLLPPVERRVTCYFNFLGWWHWSLGLHLDVRHPHIGLHVPFGFLRLGWCRSPTIDHPRSFGYDGWRQHGRQTMGADQYHSGRNESETPGGLERTVRRYIGPFHDEVTAGARPSAPVSPRPRIICLCGSTRFIEMFAVKTWELELEGFIVLGCTLLPSWYCPVRDHFAEAQGVKPQRDAHHLQKIDLADEVLVLNVGGYIGESTRNEITYAEAHGKPVWYLEPRSAEESPTKPCPECDGRGKYLDAPNEVLDGRTYWTQCNVCRGSGKLAASPAGQPPQKEQ